MSTISIHIVTYNSAATLPACLESVLSQQGTAYSVLIVDNASTDDSRQIAERYSLPLIANSTNPGYGSAHNQAIDRTDSVYVLALNPDVRLMPGFLSAMIETFENRPRLGSASGCLLRVDQLGDAPIAIDGCGLYLRRSRRQGLRHEGQPIATCPDQIQPIFGPDGAAAFYRRAMLDDIRIDGHVFDPDYFMHKEDIDLCWRAQLRGWESCFQPRAIAHHIRTFRPGRRERVTAELRYYAVRNRYLLMLRNDRWRDLIRDAWAIVPYDLAIFGFILLRERASLKAYAAILKDWARIMSKRRQIQRNKRIPGLDRHWLRGMESP